MVNSIAKTVQGLIDNDLSLQDALRRGYGNYTAIARMIKPSVEAILDREITLSSLITSVKRSKAIYDVHRDTTEVIAKSVVNLRTDIAKISIEKTRWNLETIGRSLYNIKGGFFQVVEGESAITLIFDQNMFGEIYPLFRKREIIDEKQNLAAIIIQSPIEIIDTPGCAIAFYYPLARRGVNIEETMSCFTDTIMVVPMKDVGKAFTAITNLIENARNQKVM